MASLSAAGAHSGSASSAHHHSGTSSSSSHYNASSSSASLPAPPALDTAARNAAIEQFARRSLNVPLYITSPATLRERSLVLKPAIGPSATSSSSSSSVGSNSAPGVVTTAASSLASIPAFGILALSWSPDGRRLASCGNSSSSHSATGAPPPPASALSASAAAAAANAAAAEERSTIRIWTPEYSTDTRSTIELRGHADYVEQVAYSPVSVDTLASISADRTLKLWDTRSAGSSGAASAAANTGIKAPGSSTARSANKASLSISMHGRPLNLRFHPSGNYIAIGDRSEDITLYDVRMGRDIGYIVRDPPCLLNRFTWSASGDLFFLTCGNGDIRIYDSRSLAAHSDSGAELAKRTDGKHTVLDWSVDHTISGAHTAIAHNVQLDPLGRFILSSGNDACVNLFSTASPYSATAFASMHYGSSGLLDDDDDDAAAPRHPGGAVANGLPSSTTASSSPQRAFLPPDFTLVHSFTEFESSANAIGFSADGEMWAAGGDQGWVEVASTAAPHSSLLRLAYPLGSVKALAFNPAGSHPGRAHVLAYGGEENADAIRSFAMAGSGAGGGGASGSSGTDQVGPTMSQLGAARGAGAGGTIRIVGLRAQS
ncbi:hypothetical protein V8E36_009586 [Tilletia maclaganii]